jgi:hypothetical protein
VRSGVMMVLKIARQHPAQVALVKDDDMIQTFSPDRTDETLGAGVLPRRSRSRNDLRDPNRSNAMTECRTIGFVPVPQQIAWCKCVRCFRCYPPSHLGYRAACGVPFLRLLNSMTVIVAPPVVHPRQLPFRNEMKEATRPQRQERSAAGIRKQSTQRFP